MTASNFAGLRWPKQMARALEAEEVRRADLQHQRAVYAAVNTAKAAKQHERAGKITKQHRPRVNTDKERACERCNVKFTRKAFRKPRFCSFECARAADRERFAAIRHQVKVMCARCGVAIQSSDKPSAIRKRKYCSRACATTRPKKHATCPMCGQDRPVQQLTCSAACGYKMRKLRTRSAKRCPECSTEFWPVRRSRSGFSKFCSIRCSNKSRSRRPKMIESTCLQCGNKFRRGTAALRRIKYSFCTKVCAKAYLRGPQSPLYRGEHDPNRGGQWRRLAEEIRKRDGYNCQRCTKTQQENGQKLSVDHILPWRAFTDKKAANDPRNLASLCRSCHGTKTGIYERLWLKGDVIGMEQYRRAIQLPPLFAIVDVPA